MRTFSIKLPDHLALRTEALKEKTGISESAIIRQAVETGLIRVEQAMNLIHSEPTPEEMVTA